MGERLFIWRRSTTAFGFAICLTFLLGARGASGQRGQGEWLTWGHDPQRSGWNQSETTLTRDNVSHLELKWKSQLATAPKDVVLVTLTAPLVATVDGPAGPQTRVFVEGSDNTVYAIDSETGEIAWQKRFPNALTPKQPASLSCSNTENATPVIDKAAGIIYFTTSDGKLRGLSLENGDERLAPIDFTAPFARNWSLNLIDGAIYTSTARGCAGAMAHFTAVDLKDPARRVIEFYTSNGRGGGAWGRGGLVAGPKGVYTQTADGAYDPAAGKFGHTVMSLSFDNLRLLDTFTPANWEYLEEKDLDISSTSPSIFTFQKWTLLASAGKEAVVSLLDADSLGGANHHTPLYRSPRLGNDEVAHDDRGVWGSMATWQDGQGRRWLLMPMGGPPSEESPSFKYSYGKTDQGSIMAFEVRLDSTKNTPTLVPVWMSRDIHSPDPPVVANGVVYALDAGKTIMETRAKAKPGSPLSAAHAILYAFDAETGQQLYSSDNSIDSWTHFSEPVVAGGKVYISTWDGRVCAFGLKK
jgi:outer membrane protein assembly factor BamB